MDPTFSLCKVQDTFHQETINGSLPESFTWGNNIPTVIPNVVTKDTNLIYDGIRSGKFNTFSPVFTNTELYSRLMELRGITSSPEYTDASMDIDIFYNSGNSIYRYWDSVTMANIDALFGLTGQTLGVLEERVMGKFSYCDIYGAPGGFSQYIQWRRPESYGYLMAPKVDPETGEVNNELRVEDLISPWNDKILDTNRSHITFGEDDDGNIQNNTEYFITYVNDIQPEGVDLFIGNAESKNTNLGEYDRELLNASDLIRELIIALRVVKTGGNLVLRVGYTFTEFSRDLLFIISTCFDKMYIIKPMSTRSDSSERYIVAIGKKYDIRDRVVILEDAVNAASKTTYVDRLINVEGVEHIHRFNDWLTNMNNIVGNSMLQANQLIMDIDEYDRNLRQDKPAIPRYNAYRSFIVWNIPSTSGDYVEWRNRTS